MKKSILVISLVSFLLIGCNQPNADQPKDKAWVDYCTQTAKLAETVMTIRQKGDRSKSDLLKGGKQLSNSDSAQRAVWPMTKNLIELAFEEPMMTTKKGKRSSAYLFGVKSGIICLKNKPF